MSMLHTLRAANEQIPVLGSHSHDLAPVGTTRGGSVWPVSTPSVLAVTEVLCRMVPPLLYSSDKGYERNEHSDASPDRAVYPSGQRVDHYANHIIHTASQRC